MPKFKRDKTGLHRKRTLSFIQEIFVLYFAIRDARTPFYAKFTALFALAYLISPIDLIPDFIPVVGYLDDLIIVPLLLHTAFTLLPTDVKQTCLVKAKKHALKLRVILFVILLILLMMLVSIFFLVRNIVHHF
jgi:uncharacterized membrane protein YkvA (DUF1232 family)